MRINKMNTKKKNSLIFYQMLFNTYSLIRCIEISLENLSVDIGA